MTIFHAAAKNLTEIKENCTTHQKIKMVAEKKKSQKLKPKNEEN